MTKNSKQDTNKPLFPLEYCTPERAARLLGCEVEDIFHWAAQGAITLFAEFYEYEFYKDPVCGFDAESINFGIGIYDPESCQWTPCSEDNATSYNHPDILSASEIYIGPTGFKFNVRLHILDEEERIIRAAGLLAIESTSIQQWLHESPTDSQMDWSLNALYLGEHDSDKYLHSVYLHLVTLTDIHVQDFKRIRYLKPHLTSCPV